MTIVKLHLNETAESDMWRLLGRYEEGRVGIGWLEPDLEAVAETLSCARQAWGEARQEDLRRSAGRLAALASRLGLNRLSRIARSVELLAETGDRTALAATLARLERLGQSTLDDIWKLQDITC